jgi:hypothetical protein
MRELYCDYGDRVQFVDLVVRQAHPGERHGAYRAYTTKLEEARRYREEEAVAWPVAVDDLGGTVQRDYKGMCAPIYLIDGDGRVAFYGMWGWAPPLRRALDELLARGGVGAPAGQGLDRIPHLAAAIAFGQGGPARGGLRALFDLELGFPGAMLLMSAGWFARPLLAPLVLRTTPLPARTRAGLLTALAAGGAAVCWAAWNRRRRAGDRPSRA